MKKSVNWKVLIISLIIVYSVALVGSFFTSPNVDTSWYDSVKPAITPPSWVFPIVWNILFFLIALSLYFAWTKANNKQKKLIIIVFGINFALNILWSVLFFTMKNPTASFFELLFLLFSIKLIILATWKINRTSSYLLIPYLLWVAFAGVLNYLIAFSNI